MPISRLEPPPLTALYCEIVSFQMAFTGPSYIENSVRVHVVSPLEEIIRIRAVELVSSCLPANDRFDDDYLRLTPGMFTDLLRDAVPGRIRLTPHQWSCLWIDVEITPIIAGGSYP